MGAYIIQNDTDHLSTSAGVWLRALRLPEPSSYRTFSSLLSEWSTLSRDHSVTRLFVRYPGYHLVTGQKIQ